MELQYMKNDPNWSKRRHGKLTCLYNEWCRCTKRECGRCGWNPRVAEQRRAAYEAKKTR